jgi:hypothetical protein
MAEKTATFEAGVNAATITTGAGEASATAWTLVEGAPVYDNINPAHGALDAKFSAAADKLQWEDAGGVDGYGRLYFYATAYPGSTLRIASFNAAGGGNREIIGLNSTGKIVLFDTPLATQTFTNSISLNAWVRIEWRIDVGANVFQCKLFNSKDSTTPTETLTYPAPTLGTQAEQLYFGTGGSSWGSSTYFDDIVTGATSYPGPAFIAVENLAPVIYGRGAA